MDLQAEYTPAKLYFEQYVPEAYDPTLPPIVFVHGICSRYTTWRTVGDRIANLTKRKVFVLDLRNHGNSEWTDALSLEAVVRDLEHFLVEKSIGRCVLVGHSLGGKMCLYVALRKPELVESLVAEEIGVRNPTDEQMQLVSTLFSLLDKIRLLPKSMTEMEIRSFLSRIAREKFPGPMYGSLAYYVPLRKSPTGGFEYNFNVPAIGKSLQDKSLYDIDFQKCQKFPGPALFLYVENSGAKVDEDDSLTEYFPNAELRKFSSKGHVLHLDNPKEFVDEVSKFINK